MQSEAFIKACEEHSLDISLDYSLKHLNSFKTGGVADMYIEPNNETELELVLKLSQTHDIEVQILGGGSNILIPDERLKGLCVSSVGLRECKIDEHKALMGAGLSVTEAASTLAKNGTRGLDFLYGMPGSLGGAVWMNARCYGKEISDVLLSVQGFTREGEKWFYTFDKNDFDYKHSPFQVKKNNYFVISSCEIELTKDEEVNIWNDMLEHEFDRFTKGHYIAPCAGSVFKNNRNFGAPSGKILDELQWRNVQYKGARVNPYHANIIINDEDASSAEIYALSKKMQESVKLHKNIDLEYEIILLGEKTQWHS